MPRCPRSRTTRVEARHAPLGVHVACDATGALTRSIGASTCGAGSRNRRRRVEHEVPPALILVLLLQGPGALRNCKTAPVLLSPQGPPHGVIPENAPGVIRTRDLSLRRRALYPLSYGRLEPEFTGFVGVSLRPFALL